MTPQEIHLTDFVKIFWKRKIGFFLILFVVTLVGILYSYSLPKLYRTETVIVPVSSVLGGGGGDLTGFLSKIPRFLGGTGGGSTSVFDFLMYLNSRALAARVVSSLDLVPRFVPSNSPEAKTWSEEQKINWASQTLQGIVKIEGDRVFQSQVKISATSSDPQFATKLVSQYLAELQNFISTHALTQAKRSRIFVEEQLAKNKMELLEMGKAIADFYGKNSVSPKWAKLNVPIAFKTEEGIRSFRDYGEFRERFDLLQNNGGENEKIGEGLYYVRDVPHQIYLNYINTQQQILEANFAALSQSYQMARVEESKQEPSFQVLSEPVLPIYPFSPNKKRVMITSFVLGCLLGFGYILFKEFYKGQKQFLAFVSKREIEKQESVA